MTRLIRDALLTCQKTLWRLLVLHEKGEIDLKDHKQHVDFAEARPPWRWKNWRVRRTRPNRTPGATAAPWRPCIQWEDSMKSVIYARISPRVKRKNDNGDWVAVSDSIDAQIQACQAHCKSDGHGGPRGVR